MLYSNCGSGIDTVTTARSSSEQLVCDIDGQHKVGAANADIADNIFLTPSDGDWTASDSDDLRSEQGYLDILGADEAHQLVYDDVPADFEPIVVAVIDSGIDYNHPDLQNQMYRRNGRIVGWNYVNNTDVVFDEPQSGHGTHVAGLIAAEGHNGAGVRGGAPEFVKLMPLDVFYWGINPKDPPPIVERPMPVSLNKIAEAIDFAVANGADVINMSLGSTQERSHEDVGHIFEVYRAAIQNAVDNGVFVVVAAGNDNKLLFREGLNTYPAYFGQEIEGMLTVGAYDTDRLTVSPFSNFSPDFVEVQAPGSDGSNEEFQPQGLVSTVPGGGYKKKPGTSMAAPLVSGLVALAKVYLKNKGIEISPAQLEELIKQSSIKNSTLQALAQEGRVINYFSLIERLRQIYESGILQHPRGLSLKEGQTGRLAVRVSNFSPQMQFQWYRNGVAIPGTNQLEFVIRNFNNEDVGRYHVVVTYESGDVEQSLEAEVKMSSSLCP